MNTKDEDLTILSQRQQKSPKTPCDGINTRVNLLNTTKSNFLSIGGRKSCTMSQLAAIHDT